jgi:hypothetical protein
MMWSNGSGMRFEVLVVNLLFMAFWDLILGTVVVQNCVVRTKTS